MAGRGQGTGQEGEGSGGWCEVLMGMFPESAMLWSALGSTRYVQQGELRSSRRSQCVAPMLTVFPWGYTSVPLVPFSNMHPEPIGPNIIFVTIWIWAGILAFLSIRRARLRFQVPREITNRVDTGQDCPTAMRTRDTMFRCSYLRCALLARLEPRVLFA